jgi:hypothetical protein
VPHTARSDGLGPVRSEALVVLRMESVAERVADYLLSHHPGVPRLGQAEQAVAAARGLTHTPARLEDANGGRRAINHGPNART